MIHSGNFREKNRRVIAMLALSFVLIISSLSLSVFAEGEPPAVNSAQLEEAVSDATDAKKDVAQSDDGSDVKPADLWAPKSAFDSLNASIDTANEVLKDSEKTQEQVDTQTAALKDAITVFKDARRYGTKKDEPPDSPELVNKIYLKSDELGSDGKYHFVGEDSEKKYKVPEIEEKGKTLQLNGYYTTNKSDGLVYETSNASSPLGPVDVHWSSSNNDVATVSPLGLVTPKSDGTVTVTAKVSDESKYTGAAPAKSVEFHISGQTGEYVKSVKIIGEDGKSLSNNDDIDTIIKTKNTFFQFRALIEWHDPNTGIDRIEDTRKDKITSTITWSVGGSEAIGTINADTGRFKTSEYSGNCFVQCAVTGGKGGKTVKDIARVQVDTGEYAYNPASSLKIKVIYEKFPDKVAQEHNYSLAQLSAKLPSYTNSYTVLGGARYGTIRARGYLFKDVVALEKIDMKDVYQYRFTTSDGYDNPITQKRLFGSGSRYYFPNWDIGSRAGAMPVPPMLALESNMMWGESEIPYNAPLTEGNRFRLVYGPLWSGETNSSFQIYYIKGITIVMRGAPPADNGKGKGSNSGDGNDTGKDVGVGSGTGDKGAGNGGGGIGNGTGDAGAGGSGTGGASGNSASNNTKGGKPGGAGGAKASNIGAKLSPGGDWKLYEMISNSASAVNSLDMDIPYLPAAIPIAVGGFALGGLTFFIGYRRRLRL
jgi:hypothetical protein